MNGTISNNSDERGLLPYHKALQPKTTVTGKEAGQETSKKAKKKSNEMEL